MGRWCSHTEVGQRKDKKDDDQEEKNAFARKILLVGRTTVQKRKDAPALMWRDGKVQLCSPSMHE